MNVCIGTINGKSIAYISDMPGVDPEFMPEGIHKLLAFIEEKRRDEKASHDLKTLVKYFAGNSNIFNWCKYNYKKREIQAKYENGDEFDFEDIEDFVYMSEGYIFPQKSEEAPDPSPGV